MSDPVGSNTTPESSSSQGSKIRKRYVPPQADENTFDSQDEFLDSLAPIPIEKVAENNMRCPTCWKPYGEAADPGFDNSENPVQLHCGHIFGDKCLKDTFALPGTSTLDLRQLTFTSESKGLALGHRLHEYAKKHRNGISEEADFVHMLEESRAPEAGLRLFGQYWWGVMTKMQCTMCNVSGITLFDNAVILDCESVKASPYTATQAFGGWTTSPFAYSPVAHEDQLSSIETGLVTWEEALAYETPLDKVIAKKESVPKQKEPTKKLASKAGKEWAGLSELRRKALGKWLSSNHMQASMLRRQKHCFAS